MFRAYFLDYSTILCGFCPICLYREILPNREILLPNGFLKDSTNNFFIKK
jgi:hypothetical protein